MKTRTFLTAFMAATALLLTACSSDDDEKQAQPQPQEQFTPVLRAKINGLDWSSNTPNTTVNQGSLTLSSISKGIELSISGSDINGPGTYGTANYVNGFIRTDSAGYDKTWSSAAAAVPASLTITKWDTTSRRISGTFSFTAEPQQGSGATGTKEVSEGTFTDLKF